MHFHTNDAHIGDIMKDDFYRRAFGTDGRGEESSRYRRKKSKPTPEDDILLSEDERKETKAAFSRVGLSLFAFTAASYLVILLTYLVLFIFFREQMERITSDVYFTWGLNVLSMYIVALPVLFLILRGMKRTEHKKSRLGIDEFVLLFLSAEGVMMLGNLIGLNLNNLIATLLGREITNDVTALISDSPIWLIILVAVIIGPVVEELIFRKLIIDRLSRFGDLTAVIVSSLAFGLFHGNFYQFFYALGLGLILGYIYTKTRNILYPVLMHMLINFTGSVAVLPITDMLSEFEAMTEAMATGGAIDYSRFIIMLNVIFTYVIVEYGMAIAGIVILIKKLRTNSIYISNRAEITLPRKGTVALVILNVGMILFIAVSLIQFALNIFMV